jgi:hypothetical protein
MVVWCSLYFSLPMAQPSCEHAFLTFAQVDGCQHHSRRSARESNVFRAAKLAVKVAPPAHNGTVAPHCTGVGEACGNGNSDGGTRACGGDSGGLHIIAEGSAYTVG